MAGTKTVNFANFVCRFGDNRVLLDMAEEVVIPAFRSGRIRKYGDSSYSFKNVSLKNYGTPEAPELVLVGRLVLDTTLHRDQILVDGRLVRSPATMPTAPSALFCLVLDTHKIIYLPETRSAPNLQAFRATAARLIKDEHRNFLNNLYQSEKNNGRPRTRKSIADEFPFPSVEVVALSSEATLEQFLTQFTVLRQVKIELIEPNDEIDGSSLLARIRATQHDIDATKAAVILESKQGLSQTRTAVEFRSVVEEGNAKLTFTGTDAVGDKLTGNNDKFKLGMPVDNISSEPHIAGEQLYNVFREKVAAGLLRIQAVGEAVKAKIADLSQRILD